MTKEVFSRGGTLAELVDIGNVRLRLDVMVDRHDAELGVPHSDGNDPVWNNRVATGNRGESASLALTMIAICDLGSCARAPVLDDEASLMIKCQTEVVVAEAAALGQDKVALRVTAEDSPTKGGMLSKRSSMAGCPDTLLSPWCSGDLVMAPQTISVTRQAG